MKIVFCTTCKGRLFHLRETLFTNIKNNPNAKFVVLSYGDKETDEWLRFNEHERLITYSYKTDEPFKMAHAKNMAHRCGLLEGADILINLDADNFTGVDFDKFIESKFNENPNQFLWANRNQPSEIRYPKGCNGRIAITRNAFLKSGGYDETKYNAWGPDDKDFHFRLRRLNYNATEIPRKYLDVILHNDKMRFKEYKHVIEESKYEDFQEVDNTSTIANYGNIGCGTVYRNFDYTTPIKLDPLPTRIFGIGMHKTGTTSLSAALKVLGFDSGHWNDAHWAKAIYTEMMALGHSDTLERSYALSDLPITLLYKELDKAYPGSKFILTIRNAYDWLDSVEKHFSNQNPFRGQWDTDPFTHKVHTLLYGRKKFDAATMMDRYTKHIREVFDYFKDHPNDLLVIDLDKCNKMERLCRFLNQPLPSVPYPQFNRSK